MLFRSLAELDPVLLEPNAHGDWLTKRAEDFETFAPLADGVLALRSNGVKSNRDAWVYGSSRGGLLERLEDMVTYYNAQVAAGVLPEPDPARISWTDSTRADLARGRTYALEPARVRVATYRPFHRQRLYFDPTLLERTYRLPAAFPSPRINNTGFYVVGPGSDRPFSSLAVGDVPDLAI